MATGEQQGRMVVVEHMTLAGYPMVPSDESFDRSPAEDDPDVGSRVAAIFPRIKTRVVVPVGPGGRVVRADKVYDVHYGLLSIAALSDYEDPLVPFTAWSLIRDIGWTHGGRQNALLRRCIEHLYGMSVEVEGDVPDPVRPRQSYRGRLVFRVLDKMQFPEQEERKSGGRLLSVVRYTEDYLGTVRTNPGVQIDVETLAQIQGGLPKAMYRLASWMRACGEESIDLAEAFERVGSSRKRVTPSDAHRMFGQCWEVMTTYRHIRRKPAIEPDGRGGYRMYFDWDHPVRLPSRGDMLYRALVELGVNRETAAAMIRDNKRRAARVLQAYRNRGLPDPVDTPARLIVGVFNDPNWDLPELTRDVQLDLLGEEPARLPSSHVGLTVDDLIGRIHAAPTTAQRAEWLRILEREHGIVPAAVGYRADGARLPRAIRS